MKKLTRKIVFILLFQVIIAENISAQFYYGPTEPANASWQQINAGIFNIVFEDSNYFQANYIANLLSEMQKQHPISTEKKQHRFPVLLHSQTTLSNGFVTWAPKRMEMVTLSPQRILSNPWLEHLTTHEYEHVYQLSKISHGFSRFLKIPLGQLSIASSVGQFPLWAYEGNAVITESEFTKSGRGRDPSFLMEIRANMLSGISYPYEKYYYGSFKNYVPDYYPLGYVMTSYGRTRFGRGFYDKNLEGVSKKPFLIYPYYFSLKNNFKLSKNQLFDQSMDFYDSIWNKQLHAEKIEEYHVWNNTNKKHYTSYRFPQVVNDSTIVCEKSGINERKSFVLLTKNGPEQKIHTPGIYESSTLSYANNKLCWSEIEPDIRWGNVDYSVIRTLDVATKKVSDITKKTKFFAPSLNENATKIVAVEINKKGENFLVVIETGSGKMIEKIKFNFPVAIQFPVWKNDDEIVYTKVNLQGKSIAVYNLKAASETIIKKPVDYQIGNLNITNDYLIYSMSKSGTDQIFMYQFSTQKTNRLTSSKIGAFNGIVNANDDVLIFSEYSSQGYNIAETKLDLTNAAPERTISEHKFVIDKIIQNENGQSKFPENQLTDFPSKKYRKSAHLFNFHSWAPLYVDIDDITFEDLPIYPGAMVFSQNILGTMVGWAGYSYRNNHHNFSANLTYQGLYPVIEAGFKHGGFVDTSLVNDADNVDFSEIDTKNTEIYTRIYIPFNFTKGKYIRQVRPLMEISYQNAFMLNESAGGYQTGFTETKLGAYIVYYLRPSYRDIIPRLGFLTNVEFLSSPFEHDNFGSMLSAISSVFLPGFFDHHALRFDLGFQHQNPTHFFYNQSISFPRGYSSYISKQNRVIKSNYTMPLFYPDWKLGKLLYVKRFRTTLFYDYGYAQEAFVPTSSGIEIHNKSFSSVGFDFISDFHAIHFLFPFNIGIRYTYAVDQPNALSSLNFLFSIDIPDF